MATDTRRAMFLTNLKGIVSALAGANDTAQLMQRVYSLRDYGVGKAAAFTADELATASMSADDVEQLIAFITSLNDFMAGKAVTPVDYRKLLIRNRSDV